MQKLSRALWILGVAGLLLTAAPDSPFAQTDKPDAATQAVLDANQAFYTAFRTRDLEAMNAIWARAAEVSVIHPGWPNVTGRKNVMESWRGILTGGAAPEIRSVNPDARIHGGMAYVVCYEDVGNGLLIATNIFIREDGAWRMVHHQAGPTPRLPHQGRKI